MALNRGRWRGTDTWNYFSRFKQRISGKQILLLSSVLATKIGCQNEADGPLSTLRSLFPSLRSWGISIQQLNPSPYKQQPETGRPSLTGINQLTTAAKKRSTLGQIVKTFLLQGTTHNNRPTVSNTSAFGWIRRTAYIKLLFLEFI